jgi:hypothetical protein
VRFIARFDDPDARTVAAFNVHHSYPKNSRKELTKTDPSKQTIEKQIPTEWPSLHLPGTTLQ